MVDHHANSARTREEQWLTQYYFMRGGFSVVWVALAFSVGHHAPASVAALLVIYPLWDALANYIDMSRSGGVANNRTQALNVVISILVAAAVIAALNVGADRVLDTFGVWAILSGLLQLGTAVRRWKQFGAQWAMILSGGQSALAGAFFIVQAHAPAPPAIDKIAGYAAVGAFYFLVSAVWLSVGQWRRKTARAS